MDTKFKICFTIMLIGGILLGFARGPYGLANIPLAVLGMLLIVGPIHYLGSQRS